MWRGEVRMKCALRGVGEGRVGVEIVGAERGGVPFHVRHVILVHVRSFPTSRAQFPNDLKIRLRMTCIARSGMKFGYQLPDDKMPSESILSAFYGEGTVLGLAGAFDRAGLRAALACDGGPSRAAADRRPLRPGDLEISLAFAATSRGPVNPRLPGPVAADPGHADSLWGTETSPIDAVQSAPRVGTPDGEAAGGADHPP